MPRGASGSERVIRIVIKYLLFWLWIKYGFPAWKLVLYFYLRGPFGSFWGGLAEALFRAFWCLLKASSLFGVCFRPVLEPSIPNPTNQQPEGNLASRDAS